MTPGTIGTAAGASGGTAEPPPAAPKLREAQKAEAVRRLYDDDVRLKADRREQLVKKVYKEGTAKTISTTQLQESVARQHDAEMLRRTKRQSELKQKYYAEAHPHRLHTEEIEASIQRVYAESVRWKGENLKKLEQRYQFQRKDPVKINPAQIKESSSRLSQPKKSNYTDDEINKIYGF